HHGHEGRSVALVKAVCQRLRIPNDCQELAVMTAREHGNVARALELRMATVVTLLERCDAFRKPQRFVDMLRAVECDQRGRLGFEQRDFPQAAYLEAALTAAQSVQAGVIAAMFKDDPARIPEAIRAARVECVKERLAAWRTAHLPAE
ncbi:MAG: multifunctional CCA tRNA nucleotidyl transferase/2'3'-cyclic phosphodiesterase/2'nucleotidase/phosphatase, partial [Burkholderiaceae bacterium]